MTDIAIVGMSCKLPNVNGLQDFHKQLFDSNDMGLESNDLSLQCRMRFDHKYFSFSDEEAELTDPQQKLFLAVVHWALEDSFAKVDKLPSNTGVYVGCASYEFALDSRDIGGSRYRLSGSSNSLIANRISYHFNLNGPSVAIDTACSSSLMAVKQACEALETGEIDMAIAGGVHVKHSSLVEDYYRDSGLTSKVGICKPFSKDSDGFTRGEGSGAVVLKRLKDALEQGDRVYTVIKAIGANHNGASLSISSPKLKPQLELYKSVLDKAGVSPSQVIYIESSASGLELGDRIEYRAIKECFANQDDSKIYLGVNKNRFGNLESASGIVSLIKVASIFSKNRMPTQHIENPFHEDQNVKLTYSEHSITCSNDGPYGAVNSFGFGGANAHLLLCGHHTAENPYKSIDDTKEKLFLVSAKTSSVLYLLVKQYISSLSQMRDSYVAWAELVSTRKAVYSFRLAVNYRNREGLIQSLINFIDGNLDKDVCYGHGRHEPVPILNLAALPSFTKRFYDDIRRETRGEELSQSRDDKALFFSFLKTLMSDRMFTTLLPNIVGGKYRRDSEVRMEFDHVHQNLHWLPSKNIIMQIDTGKGHLVNIEVDTISSLNELRCRMFCIGFLVSLKSNYFPRDNSYEVPNYPLFTN